MMATLVDALLAAADVGSAWRTADALARVRPVHQHPQAAALSARASGPRHLGLLPPRERDVLALLQRGLTNPRIAARLYISPRTVSHHVSSILTKLNLSTRSEAAVFAAEHGRNESGG